MTRPPLPLTMLLSRHTKRREFITLLGSAAAMCRSWRAVVNQIAKPLGLKAPASLLARPR